jgi:hypothetical protein
MVLLSHMLGQVVLTQALLATIPEMVHYMVEV